MLKRAFGVVGRVNKNTLHLPPVKRQQCLERFEVVALDQQVASGLLRVAMGGDGVQQAVRHLGGGGEGGGAVKPVKGGHGQAKGVRRRPSAKESGGDAVRQTVLCRLGFASTHHSLFDSL